MVFKCEHQVAVEGIGDYRAVFHSVVVSTYQVCLQHHWGPREDSVPSPYSKPMLTTHDSRDRLFSIYPWNTPRIRVFSMARTKGRASKYTGQVPTEDEVRQPSFSLLIRLEWLSESWGCRLGPARASSPHHGKRRKF